MSGQRHFTRYLHVISFDIPVPVNYGGAIDIYYKIKALYDEGIGVILHNFQYGGREPSAILDDLCAKVYYYPRKVVKTNLLNRKPYIVVTRSSESLVNNLLQDDYPILFEGLHSCFHLDDVRLRNRRRIVRTHNIEHEYYRGLAAAVKIPLRKLYYLNESRKLRRYESVLALANGIAAISSNDFDYYSLKFNNVHMVSAFHPHEKVIVPEGIGKFALYHGSLDVEENNRAAIFLINEVFNDLDYPLYIAGNKPSRELRALAARNHGVKLLTGLTNDDFVQLVSDAHLNVLPTFQATGIKLKLLLALFRGRHVIVNNPMVKRTGLEEICYVADTAQEMKRQINRLRNEIVSQQSIRLRESYLQGNGFSNHVNIDKLLKMLFS